MFISSHRVPAIRFLQRQQFEPPSCPSCQEISVVRFARETLPRINLWFRWTAAIQTSFADQLSHNTMVESNPALVENYFLLSMKHCKIHNGIGRG